MGDLASSVRGFNRFYTKQIGLLRKGYLDSPFSLAEVRILYELAHSGHCTASDLSKQLDLDPGYLSRTLRSFEQGGLIARRQSKSDARQNFLSLTGKGRKAFAPLNKKSHNETSAMLGKLPLLEQKQLVEAMHTIERLLGGTPQEQTSYRLRRHRPGDIGWVIHRHGAIYKQEYGWDERFEALVAEIAAKFINNYDARRERCWIAEKDGAIIGCIFLVRHTDKVAKLRLLLVEPSARGLGLGRRLVNECIRFARKAGYRKITLWTQSNLFAARHLYKEAGFRLVNEEPNESFGFSLVSETWTLAL
ncbi:MAG TPA: helix-turn-helix domain-containing GNAT family N-acetyltransferase [Bryobacteraceae bacterium]|nr:helix-turn-helix domain-containing GNAT family N-acetyltransferase [Bryobacteraceae bacterium]